MVLTMFVGWPTNAILLQLQCFYAQSSPHPSSSTAFSREASEGIVSLKVTEGAATTGTATGAGFGPRDAIVLVVLLLLSPFKLLELDTVRKRGEATRLGVVDTGLDRPL
jgi:hypothetical protein